MSKNDTWEYFKIGLKFFAVSLIVGMIAVIPIMLLSTFNLFNNLGTLMVINVILMIVLLPLVIYLYGLVANKLWKWD